MTTVAIMQPYFVPYLGYFQLIAAADVFVIYDNVQYSKGSWVNRNRLPDARGELAWLTLPLSRPPLGTKIAELTFLPDGRDRLLQEMRRFPALQSAYDEADPLARAVSEAIGNPVDYIIGLLKLACDRLGLRFEPIRASAIALESTGGAQSRVIDYVDHFKGDRYINLSGGRDLYDRGAFAAAGIELCFLDPYGGPPTSMLHRILAEPIDRLRAEILIYSVSS